MHVQPYLLREKTSLWRLRDPFKGRSYYAAKAEAGKEAEEEGMKANDASGGLLGCHKKQRQQQRAALCIIRWPPVSSWCRCSCCWLFCELLPLLLFLHSMSLSPLLLLPQKQAELIGVVSLGPDFLLPPPPSRGHSLSPSILVHFSGKKKRYDTASAGGSFGDRCRSKDTFCPFRSGGNFAHWQ